MIDRVFQEVRRAVIKAHPGLSDVSWTYCLQAHADHKECSRQYMHVLHYPRQVCVAMDAEGLSDDYLRGLFAHEFGHLILEESGRTQGEKEADGAFFRATGIRIQYGPTVRENGCKPKGVQRIPERLRNPARGLCSVTRCPPPGRLIVNPADDPWANWEPEDDPEHQRYIDEAFALFECLWPSMSPQAACIFMAKCLTKVYNRHGPGGMVPVAGSAFWPRLDPDQTDDGPEMWGYEWRTGGVTEYQRIGKLPELHAWCYIPDQDVTVDATTSFFPPQAASMETAFDWPGRKPPRYIWCGPDRWPARVIYRAYPDATAYVDELIEESQAIFEPFYDWVFGKKSCPIGKRNPSGYEYVGNCTTSDYESIHALRDSDQAVSWRTFKKYVPEARQFLEEIGAIWEDTTSKQIENSPFLGFYKGTYRGKPAYFIDWSRIEWIWVKRGGR